MITKIALMPKIPTQSKRGILGIESAIVMIAFVVVAAALAFVVLNAGFGTTQQAKTTISSGLEEASSALEIAGKIVGNATTGSNANITAITIPIKVSGGASSVNVEKALTAVRYISTGNTNISYDNIYNGTLSSKTYSNFTQAVNDARQNGKPCKDTSKTCAFIWWSSARNNNDIIDPGETAALTILFKSADRPRALDEIKSEIVVAKGAVLTIERQVPTLTTQIVDME